MFFTSTRDKSVLMNVESALSCSISPEGGLLVPLSFPQPDYLSLCDMDYAERVDSILKLFFEENLDTLKICTNAYSKFDGDAAPLVKLDDNLYVLELWHGATCAFKDMALSVLPGLLDCSKQKLKDDSLSLVLIATSGDTGKAALEGFKDQKGTFAVVLYPTEGVSEAQKLQMQTQEGNNVLVLGIDGNFDDAQRALKNALGDPALIKKFNEHNIKMTSANSINFGRLAPQIAYYFSSYIDILNSGFLNNGEPVDFCVPSGNFGNILAGYYAKLMGLPVGKLLCASNINNVLTDFLNSGTYNADRPFHKTTSPSMDILVSSNLERLLFELSSRDDKLIKQRMEDLKTRACYQISKAELDALRQTFEADFSSEQECSEAISNMFNDYGYLIDPHTAIAYSVLKKRGINRPMVLVSTANPYKFTPAILKALGQKPLEGLKGMDLLEQISAMEAPKQLREVYSKPVRFNKVISVNEFKDFLIANIQSLKA